MDNLKLESIIDLKPGDRIEIDATSEQVAELSMLYLKLTSYQNLFASFMAKSSDKADEFNLQKFLDAYTELTVKEFFLLRSIIEPVIGEGGFNMVRCPSSGFNIDINSHNNKLYVTR